MAVIAVIKSTDIPSKTRKKLNELITRVNALDPDGDGAAEPVLKTSVVAGAAADTNIAIAGIATADQIQSVIQITAGVPSDLTSEAAITSAGNIQIDTTVTTGNTLIVNWWDR